MQQERQSILESLISQVSEFTNHVNSACTLFQNEDKGSRKALGKLQVTEIKLLIRRLDKAVVDLKCYLKNETHDCPAVAILMEFAEFFCESDKILFNANRNVKTLIDNIWNGSNQLLDDKLRGDNKIPLLRRKAFNATIVEGALSKMLSEYDGNKQPANIPSPEDQELILAKGFASLALLRKSLAARPTEVKTLY